MALKINPDISAFELLLTKMNRIEVGDSLLNAKNNLLQKLEEIIQRSSPPFHPQNLENDHSEQDLNRTINYISSIIPEIEFLTLDPDEPLAPDLVFQVKKRVFFVELKVWDPGFQLLLKPALQVFKYATYPSTHGVIFILANETTISTFFDQMQGRYSGHQILQKVKQNFNVFRLKMRDKNVEMKN